MPALYAGTGDGYVYMSGANWALTRDAATGTQSHSTGTRYAYAVAADVFSGRGGTTYGIRRSFFTFNTAGISATVDSATLKIRGYSQSSGDVIAVKATSDITVLGTSDFDAIAGWDTSTGADGSGAGDQESNVTKYTAEIPIWSTSGYNNITLNAAAKADMTNDARLYVCIINHDQDLKDIAPTGLNRTGMYYANYTGTSYDPYIDYTLATTAVADNAVFFGATF